MSLQLSAFNPQLRRRRVAFFGSPAWAVPVAQALYRHHNVVLVVTQPDKPAGRGLQLTPCPVAAWAESQGLPLEKPQKLRKNAEFLELCKSLDLEVAVTAAYGKILPGDLLEVPKYGFLNLHPSDLPKYRGPAPVQWTLINGDSQTAVSLMQTDIGMDTGPVAAKFYSAVDPNETAIDLSNRLRDEGIKLLLEALNDLEHLKLTPQPAEGTHAPMLHKDDGKIIWARPALDIYNRHRGVQPWPGSWFEYQGKRVKVLKMSRAEGQGSGGLLAAPSASGTVMDIAQGVEVSTGEGSVMLLEVQPQGKKSMSGTDWARGYQIKPGSLLD